MVGFKHFQRRLYLVHLVGQLGQLVLDQIVAPLAFNTAQCKVGVVFLAPITLVASYVGLALAFAEFIALWTQRAGGVAFTPVTALH